MPLAFMPAPRPGRTQGLASGSRTAAAAGGTHPHGVYLLDFDDLGRASPLRRARRTGIRMWIKSIGHAPRTVETPLRGSPATGDLEQAGAPVRTFGAAIVRLGRDPRVRTGRFEVRLLREPSSGLRAVWLHGTKADYLACLVAPPPPMRLLCLYDADPVLAAFRARRLSGGLRVDPAPASTPPPRVPRATLPAAAGLRAGESPADRTNTRRRPR